ncbi:ribosome silencing factor [Bacillus pacificus]
MVVPNMQGISPIADYFIICHGNSDRQVQAIAREIKAKATRVPNRTYNVWKGFDEARWVLVDLGDVVAHVFHKR